MEVELGKTYLMQAETKNSNKQRKNTRILMYERGSRSELQIHKFIFSKIAIIKSSSLRDLQILK